MSLNSNIKIVTIQLLRLSSDFDSEESTVLCDRLDFANLAHFIFLLHKVKTGKSQNIIIDFFN